MMNRLKLAVILLVALGVGAYMSVYIEQVTPTAPVEVIKVAGPLPETYDKLVNYQIQLMAAQDDATDILMYLDIELNNVEYKLDQMK